MSVAAGALFWAPQIQGYLEDPRDTALPVLETCTATRALEGWNVFTKHPPLPLTSLLSPSPFWYERGKKKKKGKK